MPHILGHPEEESLTLKGADALEQWYTQPRVDPASEAVTLKPKPAVPVATMFSEREEQALEAWRPSGKGEHLRPGQTGYEPELGAGFVPRGLMSMAGTPQGRANILQTFLPEGHQAVVLRNNEVGIKYPGPDGKVTLADPPSWELADVADWLGDIPEIAGSVIGGILGLPAGPPGMVAGAIGGGVVGAGVRQALSAPLGAEEGIRPWDLARAGVEGAAGELAGPFLKFTGRAVATAIAKTPVPGFKYFGIPSTLENLFKGASQTEQVQTLKAAAKDLGIPLKDLPTDAVQTLGGVQLMFQHAKSSPFTTDIMMQQDLDYKNAILKAFSNIREKLGGLSKGKRGVDFPTLSGVDIGTFERQLGVGVTTAREKTAKLIDQAIADVYDLVPADTPVDMNNLLQFLSTYSREIGESPLLHKKLISDIKNLAETAKGVKTLKRMQRFKRDVGHLIYDQEKYGKWAGNNIYKSIMMDIEENLNRAASHENLRGIIPQEIGEEVIRKAKIKVKRYLGMGQRNIVMNESAAVTKIFGRGRHPDAELIDDAAKKVFGTKSKESIQLFMQRIMAVPTEEGVPATEKGKWLFDQMKQLYLDRIIAESAIDAKKVSVGFSGRQFYNKLFGPNGLQEELVSLIYGPKMTKRLKNLGEVLRSGQAGEEFYAAATGQAVRFEMADFFGNPLGSASRIPLKRWVASNLVREQGFGPGQSVFGQRFIREGKLPKVFDMEQMMGLLESRVAALRRTAKHTLPRVSSVGSYFGIPDGEPATGSTPLGQRPPETTEE